MFNEIYVLNLNGIYGGLIFGKGINYAHSKGATN
jgi:hypothetical protein